MLDSDHSDECAPVDRLNRWVLTELATVNRDILAGRRSSGDLGAEVAHVALAFLPAPETFSIRQAKQMVVLLGLIGASLARHYQELSRDHVSTPERAFDPYPTGAEGIPFRAYFGRLADRTGTGHCQRDSYASLTRWNVPTTEVWWAGERIAILEGVFDDRQVRTYTGTGDEQRFFELIKLSETLELAINTALLPLSDMTVDIGSDEALRRVGLAVVLLAELRRFNADFVALPPDDGLRADYFMDVLRQYAVHWSIGDIAPSGALDPEAIARDRLLGVSTPAYEAHTVQLLPALLGAERQMLTRLSERRSVPEVALRALGLDPRSLAEMSTAQLRLMLGRHPILAGLYVLLTAHARMSGVHLKIAKKYLFAPQRQREEEGLGDPTVVSNRTGTTGMDELYLEELTRARHRHALACLHPLGGSELETLAGLAAVRAAAPADLGGLLRYVGPGAEKSGPIAAMMRMRKTAADRGSRVDPSGTAGGGQQVTAAACDERRS
jgi:hypothetical protein